MEGIYVRGYRQGSDWWTNTMTTNTLMTRDYISQITDTQITSVSSFYSSPQYPFPGNGF
jgi:hypothetical protein